MQNLWNVEEAKQYSHSDLAMRVYTSRLLGRNADLVLHGGGNTSVKSSITNIFGEEEEILFVKTRELKASMTNPGAPAPSVEAILHALIPLKYVDHTHTDAVVAISNTANGEDILQELYGDSVLILPYVMPGFVLAQQVYEATKGIDWNGLEGIVLLHHGLFTFHDDAKTSYDNMINLVSTAEDYLKQQQAFDALAKGSYAASADDCLALAQARQKASELFAHPMLAKWKRDERSVGYSALENIEDIAGRGPVTPDHTLHTKRVAAVFDQDLPAAIESFRADYLRYFEKNTDGNLTCLDTAPRFAVWKNKGCVVFGQNAKRVGVISDIVDHTLKAVQWGEALGGWQALSEKDIFDLEYWELEQAKLKLAPSRAEFDGKVALVSGAASGIGKACVEELLSRGAAVAAVDIDPAVEEQFNAGNAQGIVCDITDDESIRAAIVECVAAFGGIDILVCNAGAFPPGTKIEEMDSAALDESMRLNFNGHISMMRECVPFLKLGFDPTVI
jgi:rhamnose utilization protein RhaD (predicted bifunctional aldolase and dehydrogenase)